MTFRCADLEHALEAEDPALLAAARAHAETCASCRREIDLSDALTAAARTLHREWEGRDVWAAIAAEARAQEPGRQHPTWRVQWQLLAAAAAVLLVVGASVLVMRDGLFTGDAPVSTPAAGERLLSDEALSEIERAEAQYIDAIESLARKAAPGTDAPESALLVNLRERLLVIDAAIADCRSEIEQNRFNAHLRRHLLSIYQEKRRTLEQILEQEQNAS